MSNFQTGPQFQPEQWQPPQPQKRRRWVPFVAYPAVFLVGAVIGAAGGSGADTPAVSSQPTATVTAPGPTVTETMNVPRAAPTVTVTAKPAAPPEAATTMEEDGTYLVGTDVKPGTYRSSGGGTCYWARLRDLNGDIDSIIANNIGSNPVVTIKKSDKAFETSRCGEWTRAR